jgi:hypothetical protein
LLCLHAARAAFSSMGKDVANIVADIVAVFFRFVGLMGE